MAHPNATEVITDNERIEGTYQEDFNEALKLNLTNDEIASIIGNRVKESEVYWNAKLDLDKVRDENEKYWRNEVIDETSLYEFQVPYKDNRILVAIESLIPMALARMPQPIVTPANDTDASRELAENLQYRLMSAYDELQLKGKFQLVARHLLGGMRAAYMKYRWNDDIGLFNEDGERTGGIEVYVPRPTRIVIEKGANDRDDVPLIGEYMNATVEELVYKYPEGQSELYKELNYQNGVKADVSKRIGYLEIWFTNYQGGERNEAVVWKYQNAILGKMKNPNWDYDEKQKDDDGKVISLNFLERPVKPYVIFNHLNTGRYVYDETSLTEQARPLQDILNKRGRQIVENADNANSGTIWNSEMIKPETVAKLIGDPNEKAMVKGDVTKAVMRLPTTLLQPFVLEDKRDARDEIDNIFGVHDPMRGDSSGNRTLGQDVLSQRADISRITTLATAIEEGADRLYKGLTQMYKVYSDSEQNIKYAGADGTTKHIDFSNKTIEYGTTVKVKTGSVLPDDPASKEAQTLKALPILDPLSIAEGLGKENPKEHAKRLIFYRLFPDRYIKEIIGEDPEGLHADDMALQHIELLNAGQEVPPEQAPTKMHLATHNQYLKDANFKQLPPEIQDAHVVHVQAEVDNAKANLGQEVDSEEENVGDENVPAMPNGEMPAEEAMPNGEPMPRGVGGAVKGLVNRLRGGGAA